MDERQRYEEGMKVRRAVLGDSHVDAALKNRNEFNEAFQELITRYAWGEIWTRPGLPRETRSMLTVAMMVALNREEELRMHLRAAKFFFAVQRHHHRHRCDARADSGSPAANGDLLRRT